MPTFTSNATSTGTGTIQEWTVPATGQYRIRAVGAQGGNAHSYTGLGGKGADMQGDFQLTAGTILKILVGQQPAVVSNVYSAGGGGGTFVTLNDNTSLIVAGGGNGALTNTNGPNARTTNTGSTGSSTAAGGAGWGGNGTGDSWVSGSNVAYAYVNGGKGGGPGNYGQYGGYGGGGCTHGNNGTSHPGGGGYQGGDSGTGAGAGGGSYNNGTNQVNQIYTGTGNGFVEITALNSATPPKSLTPNYTAQDPRQAMTFRWLYTDAEGNAQAQYQLQWRLKGSTTWTLGTNYASSNQYHTWAANEFTLTLGNEYEWQVRTNDGSIWSDWSTSAFFTAGTSNWIPTRLLPSTLSKSTISTESSYRYTVLKDGPVGYWPLDQLQWTTTPDISYPMDTTTDGVFTQTGGTGSLYAYQTGGPPVAGDPRTTVFDGAYFQVTPKPWLRISGSQTIEMWLYPTTLGDGVRRNPFGIAYAGEGAMTLESAGNINYYYGVLGIDSGGTTAEYGTYNSGPNTISNGSWHHIVVVRDLENMLVTWYINGVQTNQHTAIHTAAIPGSNSLLLGSGYAGVYIGRMSQVALYNYPLTSAQIANHYNSVDVIEDGKTFVWGVRTSDSEFWSPWSTEAPTFATYSGTVPTITPLTADELAFAYEDNQITLEATVTDPDADETLTSEFEIYSDAQLTNLVTTEIGVLHQTPVTDGPIAVHPTLTPGTTYYWRAKTHDGFVSSNWTPTRSFSIDANTVPTIALSTPLDAATTTYHLATTDLVALVTDPNIGQTMTVTFEVRDMADALLFTDTDTGTSPNTDEPYSITFTGENEVQYKWRAKVSDGVDESAWSAYRTFTIDALPPNFQYWNGTEWVAMEGMAQYNGTRWI